jgi:hypothetical protein
MIELNHMRNSEFAAETDTFKISTYSDANGLYKIDTQTSGLTLTNRCNFPCSKCDPSTPSICTDCTESTGKPLTQANTCVEQCTPGHVKRNNSCLTCNERCVTCSETNQDHCTSCGNETYPFFSSNSCIKVCPLGYYGNL